MEQRLEPLFTPWKIGNLEIKNRVVMTSMGGTNLLGWMEVNHFDKAGAEFILEVAKNNCGLVLPGCQPVYNPMLGQWLHKKKSMYRNLKKWMPQFHATGAKLFVQLTAGFGRSFTIDHLMETLYSNKVLNVVSKPIMNLDKITAAPSPSPNRWSDKVPSREMTVEEIKEFIEAFGKTAKLLKDAGVDGVEIHAVHEGYLLDQFTLKYVNKREDEYGGSLENRYRFAAEIVKEIKKTCGDDFPVSLRYSVESKTKGFRQGALPGEEYVEVGRDMAESEIAAKFLQDAGYDMLNCDNGTYDAWYWAHPPIYMPENCNLDDVAHIRKFVDIPVVCAGRMDPRVAADAIRDGRIDGAGFARQFLADQQWVTKLMEGREEDIRPCILCHNGCFNMCHYKGVPNDQDLWDSLHLARCAVNAETMQTNKHKIVPATTPRTVHIIGGGIGGAYSRLDIALEPIRSVGQRMEQLLGDRWFRVRCRTCIHRLCPLIVSVPHGAVALPLGMENSCKRRFLDNFTYHSGDVECADIGWRKQAGRWCVPVGYHSVGISACAFHWSRQFPERKEILSHLQVLGRHILSALHHPLSADLSAYQLGATLSGRTFRYACHGGG